jgi:hypothetical protein
MKYARPTWKQIFIMLTYSNMNMKKKTRLWCKIVPKIGVEHVKGNERSYFYLYLFKDLVQKNFQIDFYVCIK